MQELCEIDPFVLNAENSTCAAKWHGWARLQQQNIEAANLAFRQSFNACDLNYTALPCTNYLTASQDHLPQSLRFTITNLAPLSFNNSGNSTSALHTYTNTTTTSGSPLIQFPNAAPPSDGAVRRRRTRPGRRSELSRSPGEPVESQHRAQVGNSDSVRASYVGMHTYRLSIT